MIQTTAAKRGVEGPELVPDISDSIYWAFRNWITAMGAQADVSQVYILTGNAGAAGQHPILEEAPTVLAIGDNHRQSARWTAPSTR